MIINANQEPEVKVILESKFFMLVIVDGVFDIIPNDPNEKHFI